MYGETYQKMIEVALRRERAGSPPSVVAETIVTALTARRPRTCYLVGKNSRRLA